jgi:GNAT superfamily N-acetyltransferase
MRAKEITEIVKIPQGQYQISKSDMSKFRDVSKHSRPLPGGSGLVYYAKKYDGDLHIVISDPATQEVIGQLSLSDNGYFPMNNAHNVDAIAVDPDRRGQGIAKALYGIYLSILKYPLLAGHDQTPGGQRNWLSLANIPGVVIRGYVAINDSYFEHDGTRPEYVDKKFDKLLDNIMAMGGDYIGKKRGVHFFAFDVEPGTGELEPVVKKQLKLYGYHDLVNPGLYAVWGGK